MKIYYAHHQYIYFSRREQFEVDLINEYFGEPIFIINPANFDFNNSDTKFVKYKGVNLLEIPNFTENYIMNYCLDKVKSSDILVFGSIDGFVGRGVHDEVLAALENNIPVYEITKTEIIPFTGKFDLLNRCSNRIYAQVINRIV